MTNFDLLCILDCFCCWIFYACPLPYGWILPFHLSVTLFDLNLWPPQFWPLTWPACMWLWADFSDPNRAVTGLSTHDYFIKIVPTKYEIPSQKDKFPYQYTFAHRVSTAWIFFVSIYIFICSSWESLLYHEIMKYHFIWGIPHLNVILVGWENGSIYPNFSISKII